jgi:hypothetical protein
VVNLRPGQKLRSIVCDAQVVVVRAPAEDVDVACGGFPMLDEGQEAVGEPTIDPTLGDGPLIGKRYANEELGIEVLCTRSGAGALTSGGRSLELKGAKPLPSSD